MSIVLLFFLDANFTDRADFSLAFFVKSASSVSEMEF